MVDVLLAAAGVWLVWHIIMPIGLFVAFFAAAYFVIKLSDWQQAARRRALQRRNHSKGISRGEA